VKYSDACVRLTKASEGLRLDCYHDPAPGGFLTIGYGHKILPTENFGSCITEALADALLLSDLDQAWQAVNRWAIPPIPLDQGQIDALTDFTFNLGERQLANSTLLRYVNAGKFIDAANQFDLWVFSGGTVLPGLVKRRAVEKAMFLGDTNPFQFW